MSLPNSLKKSCFISFGAGFFHGLVRSRTHFFNHFFIQVSRLSDKDKDLEVIILRHQLAVMTRLHAKPVKPNRAEKMTLAILTQKLRQSKNHSTDQLRRVIRIVQPETVLRWQREMVRRKWTYEQKNKGDRPRIHQEKEDLIVRLAKGNIRWGYGKIEGELFKLGYKVSISCGGALIHPAPFLPTFG